MPVPGQISADAMRSNAAATQEALDTLERLYPQYRVVFVPKNSDQAEPRLPPKPVQRAPGVQALATLPPKSKRELVADATRGKWSLIEEIVEASGLTKEQVYGVLTTTGGPFAFEKRLAPGQPEPHGKRQYRLKEKQG